MMPLVAELAPPRRRAMMISIVFGGLFSGVLLARILSGVITQFTGWRAIYFLSFGLQYLLLALLFLFFPDYPSVNPEGISYVRILATILRLPTRQPLLVQTSLVAFFGSATFVSYWTTLTFLLASDPFRLSTLAVGLFALVGMPPFLLNPVLSHYVADRYHPAYACLLALFLGLAGVLVGTYVGTFSLAGPILMGLLVDLGMIMSQTACRTQLVAVEPKARNRVNTVFMVAGFVGMLVGTAVGNRLYAMGGWHYSGAAEIGFLVAAIVVCVARGPHETRWVGWRGGWGRRARDETPDEIREEVDGDAEQSEVGAIGQVIREEEKDSGESGKPR